MNDVTVNGVTYRLLMNSCGSKKCKKCKNGPSHGPYWWAFGMGYTRKYIGKALPQAITDHLELLKAEQKHLKQLQQEASERAAYHRREARRADDEQSAISALMRGQYVDSAVLQSLQLEKFIVTSSNGHK
jgi:hypothetical protein